MPQTEVTVGADPEFFLYSYGGDLPEGAEEGYIPCVGIVPGTKENPHVLAEGYFCHEDNVALEVGIPPTNNPYGFADSIQLVKKMVAEAYLDEIHAELVFQPSVTFRAEQLVSEQAKLFGCEPDYNAYTNGKVRTVPKEMFESQRRYAGGHIHIGGQFNCPPFVAALFADVFIGLPNIVRKQPYYSGGQQERGKWYGRPGIFRAKPYGIEYRTPSNFWCQNHDLSAMVGEQAIRLGRYLSDVNATKLRHAVQSIDWLAVQTMLSDPGANNKEKKEKGLLLLDACSNATGVGL